LQYKKVYQRIGIQVEIWHKF